MFRSFGHTNSSIVNGGLPYWEELGFPIEEGPASVPKPAEYPTPTLDASAIRSALQGLDYCSRLLLTVLSVRL